MSIAKYGIWRNTALRRFVGADALSQFGTQITLVALPLVAVLELRVSPFQLGLVSAAEMVAFLLIGLPTGVWVDRLRRRPILIAADAVRALALATVPLAAVTGTLSLLQLYAVALVIGACTVFFDVAHMSFLPSIVETDDLPRAMGTLETLRGLAGLMGPGLGGWLVQAVTAPIAVLADAITYAVSSLLLSRVRADETPAPPTERRSVRVEVLEGLRYVTGHRVLRLVAVAGAIVMFTNGGWAIVQPLLLIRELGVSAGVYGLIVSATGAGALLGAILAPKVVARYGHGRALYGSAVLLMVIPLIIAGTGPGWRLALYPLGMGLFYLVSLVLVVAQGSYRQAICPDELRGRMNASLRFLMWGALPLGGVLGGLLAEALTIQQMLWVVCFGSAAANLPYVLNPFLRTIRIAT